MFNGKKIEALEQSVITLTEGLDNANNMIETLFENIKEIVDELVNLDEKYAKQYEELRKHIDELADKYASADEEHNRQIKTLCENTDKLVAKCESIQMDNVNIMNRHNDMIKKYEQSIKGYAEQTQKMQDNILKKMNTNNIINVVEE